MIGTVGGSSVRAALLLSFFLVGVSGIAACRPEFTDEDPTEARLTKRDRLYDVAIVGRDMWVVGFPGIILHSGDAGVTWESQRGAGEEALFSVDFIDATHGYISGREGLVLKTEDGGKTWTRLSTGAKEHLFALDFVDASRGWAVGNFGVIMHTSDGGATWSRQAVGMGDEGVEFDRLLNGVAFVDAATGWVVGESGVVLHTSDGGKTWAEQVSNEWAPLYAPVFLDAKRGYVAGSEGLLLSTADGGETWVRIDTGATEHLFCLVVKGDKIMAGGRRGTYVRGKSGESETTLKRVPLGVYTWLDALAIGDDGVGLMVGGQGLILRTQDFGESWAPVSVSATSLQAD